MEQFEFLNKGYGTVPGIRIQVKKISIVYSTWANKITLIFCSGRSGAEKARPGHIEDQVNI